MMRMLGSLLAAATLCGCATSPTSDTAHGKTVRDAGDVPDYATVASGRLTVADVVPRNQIVIVAPDQEHVVWVRGDGAVSGRAIALERRPTVVPASAVAPDSPIVEAASNPRWPLLSIDGDPDSQIGSLEMCPARNEGCVDTGCHRTLEPCVRPELYDCIEAKKLDYCVEKVKTRTAEVRP